MKLQVVERLQLQTLQATGSIEEARGEGADLQRPGVLLLRRGTSLDDRICHMHRQIGPHRSRTQRPGDRELDGGAVRRHPAAAEPRGIQVVQDFAPWEQQVAGVEVARPRERISDGRCELRNDWRLQDHGRYESQSDLCASAVDEAQGPVHVAVHPIHEGVARRLGFQRPLQSEQRVAALVDRRWQALEAEALRGAEDLQAEGPAG
mmetsp:Transcript_72960/g.235977  ORF Transcript_72960/g.235977 Transcript_72960/m.235977 type:complete len:206 (+) Transcript_72960:978-1595(+)